MLAESEGSKGGTMEVSGPEESVYKLFEPDLITPEQHRDRVRSEWTDQPEFRLMLAVMEDAVATYQRYAVDPGRRNQRLFDEAESWINSTDTSWPYSFENICVASQLRARDPPPRSARPGARSSSPERPQGHVPLPVPPRERQAALDHAARSEPAQSAPDERRRQGERTILRAPGWAALEIALLRIVQRQHRVDHRLTEMRCSASASSAGAKSPQRDPMQRDLVDDERREVDFVASGDRRLEDDRAQRSNGRGCASASPFASARRFDDEVPGGARRSARASEPEALCELDVHARAARTTVTSSPRAASTCASSRPELACADDERATSAKALASASSACDRRRERLDEDGARRGRRRHRRAGSRPGRARSSAKAPSAPTIPITVRGGQCRCRPAPQAGHRPQAKLISPTTRWPAQLRRGLLDDSPTNSCPRTPRKPM